jgi:tetratricopeptide (TPR) repeat protein
LNQSRYFQFLFSLVILGFLFTGCSTKKKGVINRFYHNTTAKYNGYWNGREAVREGVKSLETNQVDDYEQILPVFPVGNAQTATSVYPQMDRGIDKASMVIGKHSMLIKGKEWCNWIDDSYMVIGQSHYYKRDYMDALEIFNYIIKQYRLEKIRFDGYNWLMRTNTALARFKDAEKMITQLEEDDKLIPKKLRPSIAASKADYYINNGEYTKAKNEIQFAIKNTKRKKSKIRYTFILAQLYAELSMKDSAVFQYTEVLKKSTPYVMEFNARINRALLTSAKSGNVEAIKRELVKMSKDEKNTDFFDRIYFALGNIALEEGDKEAGMAYLKKSVAATTTNMTQKAVSFFTIADLYFDQPEYVLASAYYDSSMAMLPEKHKQYSRVSARKESLADLVKNIRIIAYEDSMLRLGQMSESELDAYIQDIIDEVQAKEDQRKFDEASALLNPLTQNPSSSQPKPPGASGGAGAGWYFYNTTAVGYGVSDFRQKWGQRKLEDNWRRSDKTQNIEDPSLTEGQAEVPVEELMKPEYYKKNIPITDAQQDSSHKKIQYAYYDLGSIYKEKLKEYQRSIDAFEELLKRYPKGLFPLETYYQLYRLYTQIGNTAKANDYKNKILREYPDSEYAKILSDPDYLKKMEAMKGQIALMYERAFTSYAKGEHELVIAAADSVLRLYKEDKLRPKFALLRAMSIGATQKLRVYRDALEEVIRLYPGDPEKTKAEELLGYVKTLMGESLPDVAPVAAPDTTGKSAPKVEEPVVPEEGYEFNLEANHYYAVVVKKPIAVADIKGRISNFNTRLFAVENLTTKNVQLSPEQELVFVQGFPSTKKAQDYITAIITDQEVFLELDRALLSQFLISEKNFTVFYKKKNVEEYLEFFMKNYQ